VSLALDDAGAARVAAVDSELRAAAEAIGVAIAVQLDRLRPALSPAQPDEPLAVLTDLSLERDAEPDGLTLAACMAAHRAYTVRRGRPDAVSSGALALSRVLVWGQRAAMLGRAPEVLWLGPPTRRPEGHDDAIEIRATCVLEIGGQRREARALGLVRPPAA
jgi:hypothetical protein